MALARLKVVFAVKGPHPLVKLLIHRKVANMRRSIRLFPFLSLYRRGFEAVCPHWNSIRIISVLFQAEAESSRAEIIPLIFLIRLLDQIHFWQLFTGCFVVLCGVTLLMIDFPISSHNLSRLY